MKKAFTLIELFISISIFMIMVVFIYETFNQTKHTNELLEEKHVVLENENNLFDIFFEDIGESRGDVLISFDIENNARISFVTNNTYHNAFYNNITYMVSSNNKLVRIESKEKFLFENSDYNFYETAYIDYLFENIEFFEVQNIKNQYVFIIKEQNKPRKIFVTYKLLNDL